MGRRHTHIHIIDVCVDSIEDLRGLRTPTRSISRHLCKRGRHVSLHVGTGISNNRLLVHRSRTGTTWSYDTHGQSLVFRLLVLLVAPRRSFGNDHLTELVRLIFMQTRMNSKSREAEGGRQKTRVGGCFFYACMRRQAA